MGTYYEREKLFEIYILKIKFYVGRKSFFKFVQKKPLK